MVEKLEKENWLSLESNPQVINQYIERLGFDTTKYIFHDLISHEEWGQQMIPQPALAVMLLYPMTEGILQYQQKKIQQLIENKKFNNEDNLFFMEQKASNSCGTVGIFHAIFNNLDKDQHLIAKDSILEKFFEASKGQTSSDIAKFFEKQQQIQQNHVQAVNEGQGKVSVISHAHFICFIQKDNKIYKLDGLEEVPLYQRETTPDSFLKDACEICDEYMKADPESMNFSLMVFARNNLFDDEQQYDEQQFEQQFQQQQQQQQE